MLVYIIDDDESVARTVSRQIRPAGWVGTRFPTADAFLTELETLPFGCIISDIRMPGTSGTDLIRILHARCPEWPVIMMTGFAEVSAAISSFRHGAVHFLQKPFKRSELLTALEEAARVGGQRQAEAERQRKTVAIRTLTGREKEILSALADGLQSKTIAWQFGISTRTVEMHRSNILAKLGARNTSQAVGLLQLAAG